MTQSKHSRGSLMVYPSMRSHGFSEACLSEHFQLHVCGFHGLSLHFSASSTRMGLAFLVLALLVLSRWISPTLPVWVLCGAREYH